METTDGSETDAAAESRRQRIVGKATEKATILGTNHLHNDSLCNDLVRCYVLCWSLEVDSNRGTFSKQAERACALR